MIPFHDGDDHRDLVQRTLAVSKAEWDEVIRRWSEATQPGASVEERIEHLRRAFCEVMPPLLCREETASCPSCGGHVVSCDDDGTLLFGRCEGCGHGLLLAGAAPPAIYDSRYYDEKRGRAGYERYREERTYRVTKGTRIVSRLIRSHGARPRTLLEVGSGFGFTREAAEALGLRTWGVDLNPAAAHACRALTGLDTFTGTSSDVEGAFDLVLYQFVLEHVADVHRELVQARRLTSRGGLACFIVPSMEAVERSIFRARYRSYRADHLHLFSARSISTALTKAGFEHVEVSSECNLHLLAGVLTPRECAALYDRGAGPDLFVVARAL